ncbi:MAG: hypothetical protein ACI9G1_003637 [Pirellulaceae bacterium]|jgi:hypothetical protein
MKRSDLATTNENDGANGDVAMGKSLMATSRWGRRDGDVAMATARCSLQPTSCQRLGLSSPSQYQVLIGVRAILWRA